MISFQAFQPKVGDRPLLSPLTDAVQPGSFTVLSAPSGAGKSRFLETLIHSMKDYDGEYVLAGDIAAIPQSLDLCRALSAEDNVASARLPEVPWWRSLWGVPKRIRTEARETLREMGLTETEKITSLLSGGEQQRVAMARLLMSDRPVWILDEPISQLDERAGRACIERIKQHARARNAAVLCVLHQDSIARSVADRILRWDGQWQEA